MSTRESSPAKPLEIPNEPSHVRVLYQRPLPGERDFLTWQILFWFGISDSTSSALLQILIVLSLSIAPLISQLNQSIHYASAVRGHTLA